MNDERKVDGYKCLCTSDFTGKNCQGKIYGFFIYLFSNSRCCGEVVERAYSKHKGCEFESHSCHNKSIIGEDGNGKSPHRIYFLSKNSGPCLW